MYSVVGYKKKGNIYKICRGIYNVSAGDIMKYIKTSKTISQFVIYAGETDEIFILDNVKQEYEKFLIHNLELKEVINQLINTLEQKGYVRGNKL